MVFRCIGIAFLQLVLQQLAHFQELRKKMQQMDGWGEKKGGPALAAWLSLHAGYLCSRGTHKLYFPSAVGLKLSFI